jgi:hypothetical protein
MKVFIDIENKKFKFYLGQVDQLLEFHPLR